VDHRGNGRSVLRSDYTLERTLIAAALPVVVSKTAAVAGAIPRPDIFHRVVVRELARLPRHSGTSILREAFTDDETEAGTIARKVYFSSALLAARERALEHFTQKNFEIDEIDVGTLIGWRVSSFLSGSDGFLYLLRLIFSLLYIREQPTALPCIAKKMTWLHTMGIRGTGDRVVAMMAIPLIRPVQPPLVAILFLF
jgi:hypothetical protein